MSSSATPKPGPPIFANAFRHLAAAILTENDLSPAANCIMIRNASVYAEEEALTPEPSKKILKHMQCFLSNKILKMQVVKYSNQINQKHNNWNVDTKTIPRSHVKGVSVLKQQPMISQSVYNAINRFKIYNPYHLLIDQL